MQQESAQTTQVSKAWEILKSVIDPEVGLNIVDMGLVYGVEISDEGKVQVTMTLTTPGCPMRNYMTSAVEEALRPEDWAKEIDVQIVWEPRWTPAMINPAVR